MGKSYCLFVLYLAVAVRACPDYCVLHDGVRDEISR